MKILYTLKGKRNWRGLDVSNNSAMRNKADFNGIYMGPDLDKDRFNTEKIDLDVRTRS